MIAENSGFHYQPGWVYWESIPYAYARHWVDGHVEGIKKGLRLSGQVPSDEVITHVVREVAGGWVIAVCDGSTFPYHRHAAQTVAEVIQRLERETNCCV